MDIIKNLRKNNGKTQQNIADMLGISQQAYATYETGTRMPPLDILQQLADYYKVSIDYLVGRQEVPIQQEPISSKNIVTAIGRGGKRTTYELSDSEAELVNSLLEELRKKK